MRVNIDSLKSRKAQNFKNVAMTLATKHQNAVGYHLDCASFFRPSVEMAKVTPILLTSFPLNVKRIITQYITNSGPVLDASSVSIYGIKYHQGVILSTGSCSGLPDFAQIEKIFFLFATK